MAINFTSPSLFHQNSVRLEALTVNFVQKWKWNSAIYAWKGNSSIRNKFYIHLSTILLPNSRENERFIQSSRNERTVFSKLAQMIIWIVKLELIDERLSSLIFSFPIVHWSRKKAEINFSSICSINVQLSDNWWMCPLVNWQYPRQFLAAFQEISNNCWLNNASFESEYFLILCDRWKKLLNGRKNRKGWHRCNEIGRSWGCL